MFPRADRNFIDVSCARRVAAPGRKRISRALVLLVAACLCGSALVLAAEQEQKRKALPVSGGARVVNLQAVSFEPDTPGRQIRVRDGDVLSVKVAACDCPDKSRRWHCPYSARDGRPLTFSGNEWILRLGRKGAARVVGLNLARAQARSWVQDATAGQLRGVRTAYVDTIAVSTGAVFLLDGLKALSLDPQLGQDSLERLCGGRGDLVALDLSGCDRITSLAPLSRLRRLKVLDISGCTAVGDLSPLRDLKELSYLAAEGCIGLHSLGPLSGLEHLKVLDLSGCEGIFEIDPIPKLEGLEVLSLTSCSVEAGLAGALGSLAHLRGLAVPLQTTDRDLAEICRAHSGLEFLSLRGCSLVSSLRPAWGLSRLKVLQVDDYTGAGQKEVKRLGQALPQCRIEKF